MTKTLSAAAAAAVLMLGACGGGNGQAATGAAATSAATTTQAPAADASTTAAPAADAAGAEAFVRGVYAGYTDAPGGTGPDLMATAYSAELNRLISTGGPTGEGSERGLDADPICDCQDWQNLTLTNVAVTPQGADRADARVTFTNGGGAPTTQSLKLVREAAGWRVDDVVSTARPSLAAELRAAAAAPAG